MPKYFFNYNIAARGIEGHGTTWNIFDVTNTDELRNPIQINHIELKVPVQTVEGHPKMGFGMTCYGQIEHRTNPKIGQFIVINPES